MQKRLFHIASSIFLIANLLFAQVAVNFFHRNHDVHENKSITVPLKAGEASVQKHDEHCQICSVDFFNHAFISTSGLVFVLNSFETLISHCHFDIELPFVIFSQGRAPPTL